MICSHPPDQALFSLGRRGRVHRKSFKLESDPNAHIAEATVYIVEKVERDTKCGEVEAMLSKEERE